MTRDEFEKKLKDIAESEKLDKILKFNKDELGVVLRSHFIVEQLIELWIKAVTCQDDFFEGITGNQLSFSVKLKIAKNFKMPDSIVGVFSKINKMRNDFAHAGKEDITDEEIKALEVMLKKIKSNKGVKAVYQKQAGKWVKIDNFDNLMRYSYFFVSLNIKVQDIFITDLLNKAVLS